MWTTESRARHNRSKLRYPSDPPPTRGQALTDEEWSLVKAAIPPAKRGGRKRKTDDRELVNGVM